MTSINADGIQAHRTDFPSLSEDAPSLRETARTRGQISWISGSFTAGVIATLGMLGCCQSSDRHDAHERSHQAQKVTTKPQAKAVPSLQVHEPQDGGETNIAPQHDPDEIPILIEEDPVQEKIIILSQVRDGVRQNGFCERQDEDGIRYIVDERMIDGFPPGLLYKITFRLVNGKNQILNIQYVKPDKEREEQLKKEWLLKNNWRR